MLFRCRIFFWTTWCQCHTLLNYAWLFMLMQSICIAQLCIYQDLLGGPASSFQVWDWSPLTRPELWLVNAENPPSLLIVESLVAIWVSFSCFNIMITSLRLQYNASLLNLHCVQLFVELVPSIDSEYFTIEWSTRLQHMQFFLIYLCLSWND